MEKEKGKITENENELPSVESILQNKQSLVSLSAQEHFEEVWIPADHSKQAP